jgi:hypothetical protein
LLAANSAHFQLEPARLGRVSDCAGGEADHVPQQVASEYGEAAAPVRWLGVTKSCAHATKAKSATTRLRG